MATQEEKDRIMAEYLASVEDDDDDDEDEAEFQPGMDDEDDDDEDDLPPSDDDDADQWNGVLRLQKGGKLDYSGRSSENYSFALETAEALGHWNWEAPTATRKEGGASRMRTLVLMGSVGLSAKISLDLTITATNKQGVSSAASGAMKLTGDDDGGGKKRASKSTGESHGGGKHRSVTGSKSRGDDDGGGKQRAGCKSSGEEDGKKDAWKPAAAASQAFTVFGRGPGWEIYGEFYSPPSNSNNGNDAGSVDLVCRYQTVAGAAGAGAAAAKVEDDDDDVDVEEGVDYNELIALHEDAGMPVMEVRKRYQPSDNKETASPDAKRTKTVSDDDDDDDDDDIGF